MTRALIPFVVVAAGGCNALWGLDETRLDDAPRKLYFDAPIDAPFDCPAVGTVPRFSTRLTQVVPQSCVDYSFSYTQRTALALCSGAVYDGPIDAVLPPARGFDPKPGYAFDQARLGASNIIALAIEFDQTGTYHDFAYTRGGDGAWTLIGETNLPTTFSTKLSQISLGGRVYYADVETSLFEEWQMESPLLWTHVASYTLADLGVDYLNVPELSGDGLRLTFWGSLVSSSDNEPVYLDREDLASRFHPAVRLDTLPQMVLDPMIADDCSGAYFSALGSVFYAQRE